MKAIKYLTLALATLFVATACDDKDVDYQYDVQDEANTAKYQLFYVVPQTSGAAHNIYKIDVNGTEYVNKNAALLSVYNAVPSGSANIFYTAKPGTANIKLYQSSKQTQVYDNTCELLPGEQTVWVYDHTKAPVVFKETTPPANLSTDNDTITGAAIKVYNFLFATTGVPVDYKVQVMIMREGGTSTKDEDYEPYGEPIGFGECTEWFVKNVRKTSFNSSGYSTQRFGFRKIVNGQDMGWVSYTNSANKPTDMRNLTLTAYFGRAYRRFIYGITDNKSLPASVGGLTAR